MNTAERDKYFYDKTVDVTGDASNPHTHMYRLEDGMMVRYVKFDSGRGGMPVHIMQTTDMHLNCLNARDCIEALPCIVSTRKFRTAFRDGGQAVRNALKTMRLADYFDLTVVTGDTIDYLTWGSLDLMEEIVWKSADNVLAAVGGHDIIRVMQGEVPDPSTLESRYDILRRSWRHDLYYTSKIISDKVIAVVLNNGEGHYFESQLEMLDRDIEDARTNGFVMLIFQHEPLCTHNPAEHSAVPMRINDGSGTRNFCDSFIGCNGTDPITMKLYRTITANADIIKGVFCGHWHSDYYTEIIATFRDGKGNIRNTVIPQYVLTGNMYDDGHILMITVK